MEQIGYAVVGTGYFGAELARILDAIPGARVVAVHDPGDADAVAAELGCDVENDLDALLSRPDVTAVIVASPNHAHAEAVAAAVSHRVHVFCEKPVALSYADCDAMVTAAAEAGVVFMAGHVMHFFDGVRTARRLIAEGRIGEVLYCHAARTGWEPPQPTVSWKKRRELSGGHLYHHIHELDCIQSILGPAEHVTMTGGNVAHHGPGHGDEDDLLLLLLEFPGGRHAICEYGSAFRWPEHYVLIQGALGAIRLDLLDAGVTLRTDDGEERFLLHRSAEEDADRTRSNQGHATDGAVRYGHPGDTPPLWLRGIMAAELDFFHRVLSGEEVEPGFEALLTGEAARDSIATADAATMSLRLGRKVAVAEVTGGADASAQLPERSREATASS